MSVPITTGTGSASIAAEVASNLQYQRIEVVGLGGASVLGVNPDASLKVSIIGTPTVSASFSGSVVTVPTGSVITVSTGSVITVLQSSSIITVWQSSSVLAVPTGSVISVIQANSIVGTYAEDAGHTSGDKGVFVLGVRNDQMASVTSADSEYAPITVGVAGEAVTAYGATMTKWVQGTADFRQGNAGASIVIIPAQGASIFTYVTGVQIANMGSASVLVTLAGTGSVLGYSIAPAGGGSNIMYLNGLKTPANGTFAASISGIASVVVSAQGFISKS